MSENEDTINDNLWAIARSVLIAKFIPVNAYVKKQMPMSQINYLTSHFKTTEAVREVIDLNTSFSISGCMYDLGCWVYHLMSLSLTKRTLKLT